MKRLLLIAALGVLAACAKGPDPVLEALATAGLELSDAEATAPEPYVATSCVTTQAAGLSLLACRHPDPAQASSATAALEAFAGDALTAVVRTRGPFSLTIADRAASDPQGHHIAKLLKAFDKLAID